jgi:predicted acylesterase/phospholipase RssA
MDDSLRQNVSNGVPANGRYAIVFSGGGALAAWEIGCLQAIVAHERAWPSSAIGTSAGAVNAAGVCARYDVETLKNFWRNLTPESIYRRRPTDWLAFGLGLLYYVFTTRSLSRALRRASRNLQSIFDAAPLRETLGNICRPRADAFFASETNFALAMTDLVLGRRVTVYKPGRGHAGTVPQSGGCRLAFRLGEDIEEVVASLMATCAIPLLFSPQEVTVSGTTLQCFDGGVLRNCPVGPAVEFGETKIYVLIPNPKAPRLADGIVDICQSLLDTWISASLENQLELIDQLNAARRSAGQPPITIHTIRPLVPLETYGIGSLDFGKHVDTIIALGNEDAQSYFKRLSLTEITRASGGAHTEAAAAL